MDHVHITREPELQNAVLIAALGGWNDAASAATWAVKFLINQWDAQPFAEIDSEDFFDYTETRPEVRISNGVVRQFTWPTNRFYTLPDAQRTERGDARDVVLFLGEEPQFRWHAFTDAMLAVCKQFNITEIMLLGSLVAEVPHTAPVQISGTANRSPLLREMTRQGIERASYSGVTGVLTAIQDAARKSSIPAASLWGVAPHYISATPNLPVSEALLRKVDVLLGLHVQLKDLSRAAQRFTQRVSSLVADDPDVSAYVHELEQRTSSDDEDSRLDLGDRSGIHRVPLDGELPSPEEAIQDVEAWLREARGDENS